jgi:hypothetical protein
MAKLSVSTSLVFSWMSTRLPAHPWRCERMKVSIFGEELCTDHGGLDKREHGAPHGAVDVRNKPVSHASTGLITFGRGPAARVAVVSVS